MCREASDNIRPCCTFTLLDKLNEICSPKVCYRAQKIHCQQCEEISYRNRVNCSAYPTTSFTNYAELLKRKVQTGMQTNAHPRGTLERNCWTKQYHIPEYNSMSCHRRENANSQTHVILKSDFCHLVKWCPQYT